MIDCSHCRWHRAGLFDAHHPPPILYEDTRGYTCKRNLGQAEKETSLRRAVLAHASKTHPQWTKAGRACTASLIFHIKGPRHEGSRGVASAELIVANSYTLPLRALRSPDGSLKLLKVG